MTDPTPAEDDGREPSEEELRELRIELTTAHYALRDRVRDLERTQRQLQRWRLVRGLIGAGLVVVIFAVAGVVTLVRDAQRSTPQLTPGATLPAATEPATTATAGPPDGGGVGVRFEVTTDADVVDYVDVRALAYGAGGDEQFFDVASPFVREVTVPVTGRDDLFSVSLWAWARDATTVSCRILVDGDEVASTTTSGDGTVVRCASSDAIDPEG